MLSDSANLYRADVSKPFLANGVFPNPGCNQCCGSSRVLTCGFNTYEKTRSERSTACAFSENHFVGGPQGPTQRGRWQIGPFRRPRSDPAMTQIDSVVRRRKTAFWHTALRREGPVMNAFISLTAIALAAWTNNPDSKFIARVETSVWLDSRGNPIPRIYRDIEGNVDSLRVSGMKLSADDFAAIGTIRTLRVLDLSRTNVANADLRQLRRLSHLVCLKLSSTEVTDEAVDEIMKFDSLRTLCLGNVAITPGAVARLKEHFGTHNRRLALGYSQRK